MLIRRIVVYFLFFATPAVSMAQFSRVINVPPEPIPTPILPPNTQVNIVDNGMYEGVLFIGSEDFSEVNVHGGEIRGIVSVLEQGHLNIHGGQVGPSISIEGEATILGGNVGQLTLSPFDHGRLNVEGGNLGTIISLPRESSSPAINIAGGTTGDVVAVSFNLFGSEFFHNGAPITLSEIGPTEFALPSIAEGTLSGTLADGTPFGIAHTGLAGLTGGDLVRGTIYLHKQSLPSIETQLFTVPADDAPWGVRTGQSLTLQAGGRLDRNFVAGPDSRVEILGGSVGSNFESFGANIDIRGGLFADRFEAFDDSEVQLFGSKLWIDGNEVGSSLAIGESLDISTIDSEFSIAAQLADGNGVAFTSLDGDHFGPATTLRFVRSPNTPVHPLQLSVPGDSRPISLQPNQHLAVKEGGEIGNDFTALPGSEIQLLGGEIGSNLEIVASKIIVDAGFIGIPQGTSLSPGRRVLLPTNGSELEMSSGAIHDRIEAGPRSSLTIDGGLIFDAHLTEAVGTVAGGAAKKVNATDSRLNIEGGQVPDLFVTDTHVEFSGGTIGSLSADGNSSVKFQGGIIGAGCELEQFSRLRGCTKRRFVAKHHRPRL